MSTSRIRRLPDHLVNKIAAGEVVERPASVVKELVENAIDADARAIAVDLLEGGAALIRVVDDGVGMTADELPLALERHATSKLATDEDLDAIVSLGFRGEALPAICAVSRFTIVTRARRASDGGVQRATDPGMRGASDGVRVVGEAGAIAQTLTVPADAGTSVEVRDLFFNTPARLKFLKSPATELAASLRALTHLAVAHPDVQVRVTSHGRAVLTAPRAKDLRERVGALWSHAVATRLLGVARAEHGVTVAGLVSAPDLTRGSRDDIILVVNGRPVRDPAIVQWVLEAYRPLLPRDRFPLVALSLALPAVDVDVNVHPTKAIVRFRHPRLLAELIVTAVREALRAPGVVTALARSAPPAEAALADTTMAGTTIVAEPGSGQGGLFAETAAAYGPPLFGRVLGQVQDTFVVSASEREVFFVDQHVAHERVLFERVQAEVAAGKASSQALLFPEVLSLAPAARTLLERWRAPLERLGFAFEDFGGDTVMLTAVPTLLKGDEPARLLEAAADDLGAPKIGPPTVERALAFVACRAAVKADTPLAREEMERLLADLGNTTTPYFCPHGRPIVSRIALADIRRELKRNW